MKTLKKILAFSMLVSLIAVFSGFMVTFFASDSEEVIKANIVIAVALIVLSVAVIVAIVWAIAKDILENSQRACFLNLLVIYLCLFVFTFFLLLGYHFFIYFDWIKNMYPDPIFSEIFGTIREMPTLSMFWYTIGLLLSIFFGSLFFTKRPEEEGYPLDGE